MRKAMSNTWMLLLSFAITSWIALAVWVLCAILVCGGEKACLVMLLR
jgi:hypothetical protein